MRKNRFIFILVAMVFIFSGVIFAGELSVTEVEVNGNNARVVINEVIEIKDIKLAKHNVEFPCYISKSGKVFSQVKFLTEEARKVVVDAVLNQRKSKNPVKKINYKITKMSPYNKKGSTLRAFAAVTFNGLLEVECKVMKSNSGKDEYWVAWPARPPDKNKGEKKWFEQVSIINKKVKDIVEQELENTVRELKPSGTVMTKVDVNIKKGLVNAPVTVTDVQVKKAEDQDDLIAIAQVDLNYSFRISDIKVYRKDSGIMVEYPVYVSSNGREYGQIKIFSRKLQGEIKKAIETGEVSGNKSNKLGFEITKFEEFWKKGSLKYFCSVTLNGAVEIECKILDSPDYDAFVGWPSSKEGDKYIDKIVPCNLKVKETIEQVLLDRYYKECKLESTK